MTNLDKLNLEDVLESEGLLSRLSDTPIKFTVTKIHDGSDGRELSFDASYFGVRLGTAKAKVVGQKVTWRWVP